MSDDSRIDIEFAVQIIGRGFIGGVFADAVVQDVRDAYVYTSRTEADNAADKIRGVYKNLGAEEIANEVSVVHRTSTTTVSVWKPAH